MTTDPASGKGVTGRQGEFLRVDPAYFDLSKADMIPTHTMLLNQTVAALVRAYNGMERKNPRLEQENAFPAVMLSSAMFEAVVNLTLQEGFTDPAIFRELEKSTPLSKWIALRGLTSVPDFSSEPGAGLKTLFRVRNAIVHAKPSGGKKLLLQEGLTIHGVLRVSSVDRMITSAVDASCDAVTRAPWEGRLSAPSVWPWSVLLDGHGPLRWYLNHLPQQSITRTSLLAREPQPEGGPAAAAPDSP